MGVGVDEFVAKRGVEISQRDLAERTLERAADGIFDVAELKRAALKGSVSSELNESA